jgi:hypothetical protein
VRAGLVRVRFRQQTDALLLHIDTITFGLVGGGRRPWIVERPHPSEEGGGEEKKNPSRQRRDHAFFKFFLSF